MDLLATPRGGGRTAFGGYGKEELAGYAYRVYQDPADLLAHLDEVGIRNYGLDGGGAKKRSSAFSSRVSIGRIRDCSLEAREPISGTMYIPVVLVCDRPL
jgi:hypothetical protein